MADTKLVDELTTFVATDVELEAFPRFPDEDFLEGEPAQRGVVLYRDPTRLVSFGVWECSVGRFIDDYGPVSEMMHCLRGEAIITNTATGEEIHVTPGVSAIVPVGTKAIIDVKQDLRVAYTAHEETWDEERYY
jgi:uncharacterized cupin superfamily protein